MKKILVSTLFAIATLFASNAFAVLSPTYTITGAPIAADTDPNSAAPGGARTFSPPTLSVGPSQLWIYRKDGGAGTFVVQLWFHDTTNTAWISLGTLNLSDEKQMQEFPFQFGLTAEIFVQVLTVGGLSVTKCAYGFGIGGVAI